MSEAAVAAVAVEAPAGSHFDYESVKTANGTQDLGLVPILVWDEVPAAREYYGDEGICNVLDGTSLRVSFQGIARRLRAAGKTDDEIAKAQVDFRPGKRTGASSTPQSRAARAAKQAVEKGVDSDALALLMQKIASGEVDLSSLL